MLEHPILFLGGDRLTVLAADHHRERALAVGARIVGLLVDAAPPRAQGQSGARDEHADGVRADLEHARDLLVGQSHEVAQRQYLLLVGRELVDAGRWVDAHPIRQANALVSAAGVRKQDVNIFTQVGFVVLIGLACKNAILIVEYARTRHEAGASLRDATLEALHNVYLELEGELEGGDE